MLERFNRKQSLNFKIHGNNVFIKVEFPVLGRAFAEKILDRLSYYNVGKTEDSNIMHVIYQIKRVFYREFALY